MNYKPLCLSIIFLAVVWGVYFWHFGGGFSSEQGDWGTFGDFTGGVVNPLLNFITIYILITQFKSVKGDFDRQRFDDSVKAFESSFFTFSTIALSEYKEFELVAGGQVYKGGSAISFIEDYFDASCKAGEDVRLKMAELDEIAHDGIYSLISSFCVVFKLIDEVCPEAARDKYVVLFSMMLPVKLTYLLCMVEVASAWKVLKHPRSLGYFQKDSVSKVLAHYKELAE